MIGLQLELPNIYDRTESICLDELSDLADVEVSQRSLLGPSLFLIYLHDLTQISEASSANGEDDMAVYTFSSVEELVFIQIQIYVDLSSAKEHDFPVFVERIRALLGHRFRPGTNFWTAHQAD